MGTKRPRRLAAFDYVGLHAYFLTICTARRESLFRSHNCAALARDHLLDVAERYRFAVIAYCFMPDHLHALTEGESEDADFRRFVSMYKQCSAFVWRQRGGSALWQEGYQEHVLRECERNYPEIVAYILNNPVRAGLCQTPATYPFLGSSRYSFGALADVVQISRLPWESESSCP
jgi:REP element-mobilizing transposase RayT